LFESGAICYQVLILGVIKIKMIMNCLPRIMYGGGCDVDSSTPIKGREVASGSTIGIPMGRKTIIANNRSLIDRFGRYEFVGAVFLDVELFDTYGKVDHGYLLLYKF
nr:hypothetical protein [Tanacetum cinerariifolium]